MLLQKTWFRGRPKKVHVMVDDFTAYSPTKTVFLTTGVQLDPHTLYFHKRNSRFHLCDEKGVVWEFEGRDILRLRGHQEWKEVAPIFKELTDNGMSLIEILRFLEL